MCAIVQVYHLHFKVRGDLHLFKLRKWSSLSQWYSGKKKAELLAMHRRLNIFGVRLGERLDDQGCAIP